MTKWYHSLSRCTALPSHFLPASGLCRPKSRIVEGRRADLTKQQVEARVVCLWGWPVCGDERSNALAIIRLPKKTLTVPTWTLVLITWFYSSSNLRRPRILFPCETFQSASIFVLLNKVVGSWRMSRKHWDWRVCCVSTSQTRDVMDCAHPRWLLPGGPGTPSVYPCSEGRKGVHAD